MEKTITFSKDQLLGMYTAPVEVLPAPGANMTYSIKSIFAHYRFNTTPFTIGSAGELILCYGSLANILSIFAPLANFVDQSADQYIQSALANDGPTAVAVNQALLLTNDTNALTLGDGSLTLTIDYSIINVTTE